MARYDVTSGVTSTGLILDYDSMYVSSGGLADSTMVNRGGLFYVLSGANATETMENGGYVIVADGATVTFASNTFSGLVLSNDSATVHSGTTANNTTVNSNGFLFVSSGGSANDTVLNQGRMTVFSGIVNNVTVNSSGCLLISSGGIAQGVRTDSYGYVSVCQGGLLLSSYISGGYYEVGPVFVSLGGVVSSASVVNGACLYVHGTAKDIVLSEDRPYKDTRDHSDLLLQNNGYMENVAVNRGGYCRMEIGATGSNATVNDTGILIVSSGAGLTDVTVNGGTFTAHSGARLTGQMIFSSGAVISAYAGTNIDFNISGIVPGATARINDLSLLLGQADANYMLTVSATQEQGSYILAGGAADFNRTITVQVSSGGSLGSISVGERLRAGENNILLGLVGGVLSLTVQARDKIAPAVSNVQVSTTDPTNQPVVITADFSDNKNELKSKLYKVGPNGSWTDYENYVTVYSNVAVYFKAVDMDDNESEIVGCTISNIEPISGLVISSGVSVSVLEGEEILDTIILSGGTLSVSSDGAVYDTVDEGSLHVSDGGNADTTDVESDGQLYVSSGGIAANTAVHEGGALYVNSGGFAIDIVAVSGAILGFEVAPDTYVAGTFDGSAFEIADGFVSDYVIHDGGYLEIECDGIAENVTVHEGGALYVNSGGSATDIVAVSGAILGFEVAPDTYVAGTFDGSAFEIKNRVVFDYTVYGGYLHIFSNCFTQNATINNGNITVSSGGRVNNTTVSSGGTLFLCRSGMADGTTINGGYLLLSGTANDTTFNSGLLTVFSGGTANRNAVNAKGIIEVWNGGRANSTTVNSGGTLLISSNGTATGIVENGGYVKLSESKNAKVSFLSNSFSGLVLAEASATLHSGTTANSTSVIGKGRLDVFSGGIANGTIVDSKGVFLVSAGGIANDTTVLIGELNVIGGTANGTVINSGGKICLSRGGVLNDTKINQGGSLMVYDSKCRINSLTIDDGGIVDLKGTACGITVSSGGSLIAGNGDILTGRIILSEGAIVSVNGSILDFNILEIAPDAAALVNDLSLVQGTPKYTITVSDPHQESGTYLLAEGAAEFDPKGTITVNNQFGEKIGTLSVGKTIKTSSGMMLSLDLENGALSLTVDARDVISRVYANPKYDSSVTGTVMPNGDVLEFGVNAFSQLKNAVDAVSVGGDLYLSGFNSDIIFTKRLNTHFSNVTVPTLRLGADASSSATINGDVVTTIEDSFVCHESSVLGWRAGTFNGNIDVLITNSTIGSYIGTGMPPAVALASDCVFDKKTESISLTIKNSEIRDDINLLSRCRVGSADKPISVTMTLDRVSVPYAKWFWIFGSNNPYATVYTDITFNLSNSVLGGTAEKRMSVGVYYPGGVTTVVGDVTFNVNNLIVYGELTGTCTKMDGASGGSSHHSGFYSLNVTGGTNSIDSISDFDLVTVASGASLQIGRSIESVNRFDVYGELSSVALISSGEIHLIQGKLSFVDFCSGGIFISSGGVMSRANVSVGSVFISSGGIANSTLVYRGDIYVSGGTANLTRLSSGGMFLAGGTANNTSVFYASVFVSSGATVNYTSVSRGTIHVYGGTANNTFLGGGSMYLYSGGVANRANGYGFFCVSSGGTANNTIMSGDFIISSGGTANNTAVDGGTMTLAGGTANSTTVLRGSMLVSSGGTANGVTFISNGTIGIQAGGVASDIQMGSGNIWLLGKLTGRMTCLGTRISAGRGAIVDFDLTKTLPGAGARLNNFSAINGAPLLTVTVGENQAEGIYSLAEGANRFDRTITVVNTAGDELGVLSMGNTVVLSGVSYTLDLSENSTLTLKIGENITPLPYTSDGAEINQETEIQSGEVYRDTVLLSRGFLIVLSGGTAAETTVCGGIMHIDNGGLAETISLLNRSATARVYSGGVAKDVSVYSGCVLSAERGATLTGRIMTAGGKVSVYGDVDLDISELAPGEDALINDFSRISGSPKYVLTVSDTQQFGEYKLAEGVSNLKDSFTLSVKDTLGGTYDNLRRGEAVKVGEKYYLLSFDLNVLSVTCCEKPVFYDVILGKTSSYTGAQSATVSSGWVFERTTVNSSGRLLLKSGGTANNTVVNPRGLLHVSSGGTANNTVVNSLGSMYVSSGGSASAATVNMNGWIGVYSGSVDSVVVNSGGSLMIGNMGIATNIVENGGFVETKDRDKSDDTITFVPNTFSGMTLSRVSGGGSATVHSGTTAVDVAIFDGGDLRVYSGGTASSTIINAYGRFVLSGGTASDTIVNTGGSMYLSYGVADNTIVNSRGLMYVSSGGTANGTIINAFGTLRVSSGGVMNNIAVGSSGIIYIYGGTVTGISMNGGRLTVSSGASVTGIDATSGTSFTFTIAPGTDIIGKSEGSAFEIRDGFVSGYVLQNGYLTILSGGTANALAVGIGGYLAVSSGGVASDVIWNPCEGEIYVEGGGSISFASRYSGVYYGSGGILVSNVAVMDSATIESPYQMFVMSDGIANNTTVKGYGTLHVYSGGIANSTVVNSSGNMFISSAGAADGVSVDRLGFIHVYSSGSANNVSVDAGGRFFVSSGGTATGIMENGGYVEVEDGANAAFVANTFSGIVLTSKEATVHSGTTATETTIGAAGYAYVFSGGQADKTVVNSGGQFFVSSGGTAAEITENGGYVEVEDGANATFVVTAFSGIVLSGNSATVHSGTTATETTLNTQGGLFVFSGGTANQTTVNSYGSMAIYSGGIADGTTVNSYGSMDIFSGGIANQTTVNSCGGMAIYSGGKASNTTVNSCGSMEILSGGIADGTAVDSYGILRVSSGGKADNTTVDVYGSVYVLSGAETDSVTVNTSGRLFVSLDGKADNTTVFGSMFISAGGTADNTTVFSRGFVHLASDGVLNSGLVDVGGSLYIASGGSATEIVENGGYVEVEDGANVTFTSHTFSGLVLSVGIATVHSGTTADGTVLNSYGSMGISSSGIANNTSVFAGGCMGISSDGLADNTAVGSGGYVEVEAGGRADHATVNVGGYIYVASEGIATEIMENGGQVDFEDGANVVFASHTISGLILSNAVATVHSGTTADSATIDLQGVIILYSGGAATGTTVNADGFFEIGSGGTAGNTIINTNGYMYVAGTAIGTTVNDGGTLEVTSGGTANVTTVNSESYFVVISGGTANDITVNDGGYFEITSGGTANDITLYDGGYFVITSGGTANETTVNEGGVLDVTSRGTANGVSVFSGGLLSIASGGTATEIRENGGFVDFEKNANVTFAVNTFSGLILSGYEATVHSGTTAESTVVNTGTLLVYSGGIVTNTAVDVGVLCVYSGGVVNGIAVNAGCYLEVWSGGKMTGQMTFEENADVYIEEGVILDFDISELTPEAGARINTLALVPWETVFTLTVSDKQVSGVYTLAEGAAEFNGTITVQNTFGESFGTFEVGETLEIGYNSYTLNLTDDVLSVTIEAPDLTPTEPTGTAEQVSWVATGANQYIVEYSTDGFEHVVSVVTAGDTIDMPDLPAGNYQWRVKADANSDWVVGNEIKSDSTSDVPKVVQSNEDGNDDLFFATANGIWSRFYFVQHVGSVNDGWGGTNEVISPAGKGRIQNLFFGSADPNVLCLTDGENGDAIFVDDVYTDLPDEIAEQTSRLYRIQEVRAGAGDDIVDMTSQRFEYTGDGLVIRGGAGDDTIWANRGDNWLFGDAGNDRIVGASGNDVIAGGIGNDRMHGGGGGDVFTFGENFGTDTVEQLASGSVTLWFTSGSMENWDAGTLTYTDGDNSVKVSGIEADKITLKFGDDGSEQFATLSGMGAFADFTSEKVFEESGKGILASL